MPDLHSDKNRLLAIKTVLAEDVLLVNRVTANENLSRLFNVELDVMAPLSLAGQVKASALLGTKASMRMQAQNGEQRFFHGIVSRFQQGDQDNDFRYFRIELSPWLWLLSLVADCRVFENKTVPEIITDVFRAHDQLDFLDFTTRAYSKIDCCIQYRETCFDFVSRLMEHEGIFYFFKHEKEKHTLCFADQLAGSYDSDEKPVIHFDREVSDGPGKKVMSAWSRSDLLTPGKFVMRDFHYGLPNKTLEFPEQTVAPVGGNQKFEVYDFPGKYAPPFNEKARFNDVEAEGERLARVRMEEKEAPQIAFSGVSPFHQYRPGFKFDLDGHPTLSGTFVPLGAQHIFEQSASHFHNDAVVRAYTCNVTCSQLGKPFRPARVTSRPIMRGPQTAMVTGPDGSEIFTDEFGRVKVHFHWDRKREGMGCWVRVAQIWAGSRWGAQFLPRIGQEVVVDFIEGDPDQPIIVGSVYNASNQYPYTLPDNQTQSGIKSRSTRGGGSANFNEIRFEDKKGAEEIHIQAERNLTTVVEAEEARNVGASRTTTIAQNDKETVEKGDHTLKVEKGNRETTISIGNDKLTVSKGGVTHEVPLGTHKTTAMTIEVTATAGITLKCGASTIDLKPAMITIQAPLVKIN